MYQRIDVNLKKIHTKKYAIHGNPYLENYKNENRKNTHQVDVVVISNGEEGDWSQELHSTF